MPKEQNISRHLFIPDTQIRPGVHIDHIDWIARSIVDYMPDVVIVGGDFWDFASLNGHEEKGSAPMEGRRVADDIEIGNGAFERLCLPMEKEIVRRRKLHKARWEPRKIFLTGNHEDRADRVAVNDPKWKGVIGSQLCNVRDFERHKFLERVWCDGIVYSHFFSSMHSSMPIGGSIDNRLNKIGDSFVQGHQQGFLYGTRIYPTGKTRHGLVAGSAYTHIEDYRGAQGQKHFRGIVVLNEVKDGDYSIMPLSLDFLCRKNEGVNLATYMTKKYPKENWDHLA